MVQNRLLNGKGGVLNTLCSDDASVTNMAAEKAITCVLFDGFLEPDEMINTAKCTRCYSHCHLPYRIKENIPIE